MLYNQLYLSGVLRTYLANLNEQAQNRMELLIGQKKSTGGLTENLKQHDQLVWVGMMKNIRNHAEEIIISEMICH